MFLLKQDTSIREDFTKDNGGAKNEYTKDSGVAI